MIKHRNLHLLLPLLSLSMALAMAGAVHAQDHNTTSAGLQIRFASPRHWLGITGTRVEEMPASERPDYDMYRYGGNYYAYNNRHWYMSSRESGDYLPIDDGAVPSDFASVPRDHWRNYPSAWQQRSDRPEGSSATLQVQFKSSPRWLGIGGTHVEEINAAERPDNDVFRYGGSYYAYDHNQWYRSNQESGDYSAIGETSVPTEFTSIPREHWRNYPSAWRERHDQQMGDRSAATLDVRFGTAPHWSAIEGTHVDEVTAAERPDYDMFRYGGGYYAYDNNQWYMGRSESGRFTAIDDSAVPAVFSGIPREHWRNYPSAWWERHDRGVNGSSATLDVTFASRPHWNSIRGTQVREIRQGERPDYDMFRYGGSYYAYNNNRWYTSRRATGQFVMIDERAVPTAFTAIPRDHWRNYPSEWQDTSGNPRHRHSKRQRHSYGDQ